jgi:hypothetical protein
VAEVVFVSTRQVEHLEEEVVVVRVDFVGPLHRPVSPFSEIAQPSNNFAVTSIFFIY